MNMNDLILSWNMITITMSMMKNTYDMEHVSPYMRDAFDEFDEEEQNEEEYDYNMQSLLNS